MKYYHRQTMNKVDDFGATVIADTGWYDPKTNLDTEPKQPQVATRYRFVLIDGKPLVLSDYGRMTDNGYRLTDNGLVKNPGKPYYEIMRSADKPRYSVPEQWLKKPRLASYMTADQRKHYRDVYAAHLHPRFTALKNAVRDAIKDDDRSLRATGHKRRPHKRAPKELALA